MRPTEALDLPDRCEVELELRTVNGEPARPSLEDVYAILDKRVRTGESDVAARHNEHQP